jgi:hypothetical protein
MRARGVPHFHHHRHLQLIDLEYSSSKLQNDTLMFLETTRDKNPKAFEKLQKNNKLWIEFRLLSNGPIQIEDLIEAIAKDEITDS